MNKSLFYQIVIIALLLLNTFLMFKIYSGESKCDGRYEREDPRQKIIKKLNFNDAQKQQFQDLIEIHHSKVSEKDKEIMALKKKILESLSHDSVINFDNEYQRIGELRAEIESIHFNHFLDIKSICRADQLEAFNNMTSKLMHHFGKKPHGRPHHKKERKSE